MSDVARHLQQLNIEPPETLALPQAIRRAAGEVATRNVVNDLREELLAGKLTVANVAKRVEAVAARRTAQASAREVAADLEKPLAAMERAATIEHGDTIIVALRVPFDAAANVVAVARGELGPAPQREAVLAAGPTAAGLWHEREAATRTLALVRRARLAMAKAGYGTSQLEGEVPWWLASAADADDLTDAAVVFHATGNEIVNLIDSGRTVRLNTASEAAQVAAGAAAVTAATQAVERERTDAERAAYREMLEKQIAASEEQGRQMLRKIRTP